MVQNEVSELNVSKFIDMYEGVSFVAKQLRGFFPTVDNFVESIIEYKKIALDEAKKYEADLKELESGVKTKQSSELIAKRKEKILSDLKLKIKAYEKKKLIKAI